MGGMRVVLEHVRRMRGGAQAHLVRCDDDGYYIVKFQNNPQHVRVLANEMLATRLAARLGLCVPQVAVVEVRPELISYTTEMVMQLGLGRIPCSAGKQFGSQFPGHPARMTVHDFLPDEQLCAVRNLSDFLGIFVFDKWTCNTNGRQAIFFRELEDGPGPPSSFPRNPGVPVDTNAYTAMMIDHGFCFNAGEWDFPDAPLRGLYARQRVYESVAGMDAFEPWLERLEKHISEAVLGEEAERIPPEWYQDDWDALARLLEKLYARRGRVRELIMSARNSSRAPFPNWKVRNA
jgi:hypothetical protein